MYSMTSMQKNMTLTAFSEVLFFVMLTWHNDSTG